MKSKLVYVAGYPKSGTTWLTRLMADALDSPAAGSCPQENDAHVAEGQDRPGLYLVRKGHYLLTDEIGDAGSEERYTPAPHRLCRLTSCPVLHIVRDPRAVIASAAAYHGVSAHQLITEMGQGQRYNLPHWGAYEQAWLDNPPANALVIRYEDLLRDTAVQLIRALTFIGADIPQGISQIVDRQSLLRRKEKIADMPIAKVEVEKRLLRKGKPSSWRDELMRGEIERIGRDYKAQMNAHGYV